MDAGVSTSMNMSSASHNDAKFGVTRFRWWTGRTRSVDYNELEASNHLSVQKCSHRLVPPGGCQPIHGPSRPKRRPLPP